MANSFSGKLWVLDTADANNPQMKDAVLPLRMRWKPSAAGQSIVVKNKNGLVYWSETSLTAYPAGALTWENPGQPPEPMDGFWLQTLTTGGTLEVTKGV